MKVKELHTLLSKALIDKPDIADMSINIDSDLDDTLKLGIYNTTKQVLILCEDSYLKSAGMTVYEL